MDPRCPGRIVNASVESTLVPCPACGRSVEIFGDEEKVICRCGQEVFREARPACFQWCKQAARCSGQIGTTGATRYQEGLRQAFEHLREHTADALPELGVQPDGQGRLTLQVLDKLFFIDPPRHKVTCRCENENASMERDVSVEWQILALHYLGASRPEFEFSKWISFADIPDARGYEKVYRGRILGRLLRTIGKDRDAFAEACRTVGGQRVPWGDVGFQFTVFPRLSVIIAWYQGDDELSPNVSFLYPDTIHSFLAVEDIVVLSELLVGRLQGTRY